METNLKNINRKFIKLPLKLLLDDNLLPDEKMYYACLLDRSTFEDRGWSRQSHTDMAKYGFSVRSSERLAKVLSDKGYIEKKRAKYAFISIPKMFYENHISLPEGEDQPMMSISRTTR